MEQQHFNAAGEVLVRCPDERRTAIGVRGIKIASVILGKSMKEGRMVPLGKDVGRGEAMVVGSVAVGAGRYKRQHGGQVAADASPVEGGLAFGANLAGVSAMPEKESDCGTTGVKSSPLKREMIPVVPGPGEVRPGGKERLKLGVFTEGTELPHRVFMLLAM
jgi:hypothetical protein